MSKLQPVYPGKSKAGLAFYASEAICYNSQNHKPFLNNELGIVALFFDNLVNRNQAPHLKHL